MTEHTVTSRGFKHLTPITGTYPYNWLLKVYESSAAFDPAIWIAAESDSSEGHAEVHAHLNLDEATLLRDQLSWIIDNHFLVSSKTGPGQDQPFPSGRPASEAETAGASEPSVTPRSEFGI